MGSRRSQCRPASPGAVAWRRGDVQTGPEVQLEVKVVVGSSCSCQRSTLRIQVGVGTLRVDGYVKSSVDQRRIGWKLVYKLYTVLMFHDSSNLY